MTRRFLHHTPRRSRSAIALIELLFVIAILGVFAVIASSIFTTTMKILHRASTDDASARAMDSAMRHLRSDVWNATAIQSEASGLSINRPDGPVKWSLDETKQLVRSTGEAEAASAQSWPVSNLRVAFDVNGPTVGVEVSAVNAPAVASERLVSQTMLVNGGGS